MTHNIFYDNQNKTLTLNDKEYNLYLSDEPLHPLMIEVLRFAQGLKSAQDMYTDILVLENKLINKGD